MAVLNSGLIASGSEDCTMRMWNRESGAEEQVKMMMVVEKERESDDIFFFLKKNNESMAGFGIVTTEN